jgi:hypothetical protein
MKKMIFMVAVTLSACNSASVETSAVADSTNIDSISVKIVDSVNTKVDSSKSIIDTIKK